MIINFQTVGGAQVQHIRLTAVLHSRYDYIYMLKIIFITIFVLNIYGCGGGGESNISEQNPDLESKIWKGVVVDPYISGANIWCDVNQNNAFDENQDPHVLSENDGSFELELPVTQSLVCHAVATEHSMHNGEKYNGHLKSRFNPQIDQSLVISPLTTLLANGVNDSTIRQQFYLESTDNVSFDYMSNSSTSSQRLRVAAWTVEQLALELSVLDERIQDTDQKIKNELWNDIYQASYQSIADILQNIDIYLSDKTPVLTVNAEGVVMINRDFLIKIISSNAADDEIKVDDTINRINSSFDKIKDIAITGSVEDLNEFQTLSFEINTPPVAVNGEITWQEAWLSNPNQTFYLPEAIDSDGDNLFYNVHNSESSIITIELVDPEVGQYALSIDSPIVSGQYDILYDVTDSVGDSSTAVVTVNIPNWSPQWQMQPNPYSIDEYDSINVPLYANDNNGDALTYHVVTSPSSVTAFINGQELVADFSNTNIADTERCGAINGCREVNIDVAAVDTSQNQSITTIIFYVMAGNETPIAKDVYVTAIPDNNYQIDITAIDENIYDINNLIYELESPIPEQINAQSPIINSSHLSTIDIHVDGNAEMGRTYSINYRVTDTHGATDSATIFIVIDGTPSLRLQDQFYTFDSTADTASCQYYASDTFLSDTGIVLSNNALAFSLLFSSFGTAVNVGDQWSVAFEFSSNDGMNFIRVAVPNIVIAEGDNASNKKLIINGGVYLYVKGTRSNGDSYAIAPTFYDDGTNNIINLLTQDSICADNNEQVEVRLGIDFNILQELLNESLPDIGDIDTTPNRILAGLSPLTMKVVLENGIKTERTNGDIFSLGSIEVPEYLGGPNIDTTGYMIQGNVLIR